MSLLLVFLGVLAYSAFTWGDPADDSTNWWSDCKIVSREVDRALADSNEDIEYSNEGSVKIVEDSWGVRSELVRTSVVYLPVQITLTPLNGTVSSMGSLSRAGVVTNCFDSNINSTTGEFYFKNFTVTYGSSSVKFPLFTFPLKVSFNLRPTFEFFISRGSEGCRLWSFKVKAVEDIECKVEAGHWIVEEVVSWLLNDMKNVPLLQQFLLATQKHVETNFAKKWCSFI